MTEALVVAIIAIFFSYIARYERFSKFLGYAFILITVFLSIAYGWGNDYDEYLNEFNSLYSSKLKGIGDLFDITVRGKSEVGWTLLNFLCQPIGFLGLRFVVFSFTNTVLFFFIKKYVTPQWYWLAMEIYVFNVNFMVLSSSMMRQWLAMCICVLAFMVEVKESKKLKKILPILLLIFAASIHTSALVLLPFISLRYFELNFKPIHVFLIFIVALIWMNSFQYIYIYFLSFFDFYQGYDVGSIGSGLGIIKFSRYVFYAAILFCFNQFDLRHRTYLFLTISTVLFIPMMEMSYMTARLIYYFLLFSTAAYPIVLEKVKWPVFVKIVVLFVVFYLQYVEWRAFWNPKGVFFQYYNDYTTIFSIGHWI